MDQKLSPGARVQILENLSEMYLNCHSYHSLRYGTIPLQDLVELGRHCQVEAMALTDVNTVTGVYEFLKLCKAASIKPLIGIEFRQTGELRYIGLAHTQSGFAEMNSFLTARNFANKEIPRIAPEFENVSIIYSLENAPEHLSENQYIGIRADQLSMLYKKELRDRLGKMVVLQPVTVRSKSEFNLHRILRAVDLNILGSRLTPKDHCRESEVMIPISQFRDKFTDYPQILRNTKELIDRCNFDYDFNIPRNKKHFTSDRKSDMQLLTRLAEQGMLRRYGSNNIKAIKQVKKELKVIDELEFSGYFLITWDIIQYSNSMGFLHIGRGSGANSIISYCLGITDICPLELDLYFERFLNVNRKSPPDFDLDWSWTDRDTILSYIFNKYGADHVAFCGTNVEFKKRSIIREIGKVFGLPKHELDVLSRQEQINTNSSEVIQSIYKYGQMLAEFPNMRSMHSCGIIISEDPITNYTALEMPPKGFPIVQFDMHVAEDIGFDKFDILSQRGIGTINDTVKLIKRNRNIDVDIRDTRISKDEKSASEFLALGRTIGCFYIESPAMRGLLRRLKCDNYKTLVAASSIIRPGVAKSGMMQEYIFRHNNPDKFEYFHDVFKEHLGETYGIMVYQEDVIKIALHYGGLDAADGDILRRAMSGKGRSKAALEKIRDDFFASCLKKGHPEELSTEIYRQIKSFAGYSFCKAHSASYAVESYQALYLKVHFPIEFMVAVINNSGGFYRTEVYIHEARMSGATIHNPCVNKSEALVTVYGKDVYLGFMHLKSLNAKLAEKILTERERNGEYKSLEDFISRIQIGIESIQILIFVGAFRFTGKTKNQLIITARLILVNFKPEDRNPLLISQPIKEYKLPQLNRSVFEDAFDEIEHLEFPVSCSIFDLLKAKSRGDVFAKDLMDHHKKDVRMVAYLVSTKQVPTKKGDMYFGTWIDAYGDFFDTAHFSDCLQKYPFKGGGCYVFVGKVEIDCHFPTITVTRMEKLPFISDPRFSNSPDHQYKVHENLRADISLTQRAPYPQESEIGLPRKKMPD